MSIWPPLLRAFRVSQWFGENPEFYAPYKLLGHHGIDIPGEQGEPLYAGVAGRVYATQSVTEGICVRMASDDGLLTYRHCQCLVGPPERTVRRGEMVGLLGNTGTNTTGAHVHVDWTPANADYDNGYKGMIDPWPLIQEGMVEMNGSQARILLQTQSANYPDWVVEHARRLGGAQLINPWRGAWWKFRDAGVPFVLGRYVSDGDADKELVKQGAAGAEIWFRDWFLPNAGRCPGITVWCGHNEQPAFNADEARAQDAFISRLADLYHDHGLQIAAYRVSTHHWEYGLWQYFAESLTKVDYLARNSYEYGQRFNLDDTNGLMRLVKDVEAIRGYGLRVPPCILTELGYDSEPTLGIGHQGWRTRGIDNEAYTTEIVQAMVRLGALVPELRFVSSFLWQNEDPAWASFLLDMHDSELLVEKAEAVYAQMPAEMPAEAPIAEIIEEAQRYIIPRTPGYALYEAGRAHGYHEASGEFDVGGWRCQAFRDPLWTDVQRIAYCRIGDWGDVRWVTVDNKTHEVVEDV